MKIFVSILFIQLQIITSGGVTYKNDPWHRECFTCTHCSTSLAGQRFTSRDDKPYCADCFGELFAKRCTACTKPITGKFFFCISCSFILFYSYGIFILIRLLTKKFPNDDAFVLNRILNFFCAYFPPEYRYRWYTFHFV